MMKKRIISAMLAAALCAGLTMSAYAAELTETGAGTDAVSNVLADEDDVLTEYDTTEADTTEPVTVSYGDGYSMTSLTLDDMYSALSSSFSSTLSFSECLSSLGLIETSFDDLFSLTALGISMTGVDTGLLNLSYASASQSMSEAYDAIDLSGMSAGCMQLFSDTYGDVVSGITYSAATLPEDFDVNSMLSSAAVSLSDAYGEATSNGAFAAVKDSISIGDVFEAVAAGPTTTGLAIAKSSKEWVKDNGETAQSNAEGYYNRNVTWADSTLAAYNSLNFSSISDVQSAMNEHLSSSDSIWSFENGTTVADSEKVEQRNGIVALMNNNLDPDSIDETVANEAARNNMTEDQQQAVDSYAVKEFSDYCTSVGSGVLVSLGGEWTYSKALAASEGETGRISRLFFNRVTNLGELARDAESNAIKTVTELGSETDAKYSQYISK